MCKRCVVLMLLFFVLQLQGVLNSVENKFNGLHAQSVGGTTSGATSYCTTTNSGVVTVAGYNGSILNWQSTTDGGLTWNSNVNTTPNQTYFNLNQTTCYRAVVQDGMFPADTSTVVCITVYPPSIGGAVTGGGAFCDSTGSGSITLSGYSGSITNWLFSVDGGNSWTTIADTNATLNYTSIAQNTIYEAVVQNGMSCPSDSSDQAIFNVAPQTEGGILNGGTSVCITANTGTLTLVGYAGSILSWLQSLDNGNTWTPFTDTTNTFNYINLTQSTMYKVIVKSGICNADTSSAASLIVDSALVTGSISGGGVFCGTPATGILNLAGFTGTIQNWISSTDEGTSWTTISNNSNAESYTNLPATTWYAVIVQSGSCGSDTSSIEIIDVSPQTVAGTVSSSATVCTGINLDSLVLNGNVGSVLHWLSSTDNEVSWSLIANISSTQTYAGLTQTTQYAAVVQSGSCNVDTTQAAVITVVALPMVNAGTDVSIFQGESVTLSGSGTGAPLWMPATGLSAPATFTPSASPSVTTSYVLAVMDSNNCVNADTVLVTVLLKSFNGKVSNLFTPNGDGLNDVWYVENIQNYPGNKVFVYNIYGKEVYKMEDYQNDWKGTYNGSDLPDGTYYYVIRFDSEDRTFRGSVDILRSK